MFEAPNLDLWPKEFRWFKNWTLKGVIVLCAHQPVYHNLIIIPVKIVKL